jgi:hypothetical protein
MNIQTQSWLLNRRHALKALGSFISLPMLECMVPLRAAEKATATPKRSAFIYLANGVHSLNYQITDPGKDYQFSRSLKPLEKHREVITPISGLHHPGASAIITTASPSGSPAASSALRIATRSPWTRRWPRSPRRTRVIRRWRSPHAGFARLDGGWRAAARDASLQRDFRLAL